MDLCLKVHVNLVLKIFNRKGMYMKEKILIVEDDEILKRITGRRVSKKTGKIYHVIYNPPVDENPEDLEQRADDTEEVVLNRLKQYIWVLIY